MAYTREIEKLKRQWDENPKGTSFAPLAELYRKDGQHEKAMEVLKVGLESNPKHIPGNIVLGRCCLDLKQDAEAEVAFSRALELDPENVIALKALADITERAGRLDEANIWLQQLVAVDPSNDDARDQLNRVTTAMREPEPEPEPEPVAEEEEPLVGFQSESSQPLAPAEPTAPSFDEPFTIEARPPAPFSIPSVASAPPLELTPQSPATPAPAAPLAGFESSEFDARAAAEVSPQGIPGMVFEHPPESAGEPLIGSGSAAGGSGDAGFDVGLEKAEEIVLRPSSATEFQTDSASESMATAFKGGTSSEFQTASASEDMAAAFAAQPEPTPAPAPAEPAPVEDASPVVSEYSPAVSLEQWAPPSPPIAAEPTVAASVPAPEPEPEPMSYQAPPAEVVPEHFVFAAPEPEPASASAAPAPPATPSAADAAPEEPARAQAAEGLRIIYPPTPATAAESEETGVGGEPEPVVTETMAELYLRQGLRHEALRVYRLLSDRAPGDLHLRERVTQLESDLAQFSANRRAAAAITATATGGESVGALFQGLLGSPVGASGLPPAKSSSSVETPAPSRGGAPTRPAQDSLSLSAIFGEDTSPVPPTVGGSAESGSGTPTGLSSGGVSFDQFFGDQAPAADGSNPGRRASRAGGADEDLDQFQDWLKSLKR